MEKSERHSLQGYTPDSVGELVQQYRETLSKVSLVWENSSGSNVLLDRSTFSLLTPCQVLPDLTSIIAKWQSISKKEKATGEEKQSKMEEAVTQTSEENENPGTGECDTDTKTFLPSGMANKGSRLTVVLCVGQLLKRLRWSCWRLWFFRSFAFTRKLCLTWWTSASLTSASSLKVILLLLFFFKKRPINPQWFQGV